MRKSPQVTEFPDRGLPRRRRDFSGENTFLEFRLERVLSDLEKKTVLNMGRKLKFKDFTEFLFEVAHLLPGESIRLANFFDFWNLDVQASKVIFGNWSKKKNHPKGEPTRFSELGMKNDWESFETQYSDFFVVPLSSLRSFILCRLEVGSDAEKFATASILEHGIIDFDLMIDAFSKFLEKFKSAENNSSSLESLKKAVSTKVRICLEEPAPEPRMAKIYQFPKMCNNRKREKTPSRD